MKRTFQAHEINEIAKHPEVRPWLGEPDPLKELDYSQLTANPDNFFLTTDCGRGAYALIKMCPGLFSVHTLAVPAVRGRPMHKLMISMFDFMFSATDCLEIVSMIPDGNQNALSWADLAGMRHTFRREGFFPLMDELVGGQFVSLAYNDWVGRSSECRRAGRVFHELLHTRLGHENHPEDDIHNRWVGSAIECGRAGNLAKGVLFYNRWACVAGYQGARIVSANPPLVDIGTALISLDGTGVLDVVMTRG